jgi:hypothetical protein
MATPSDEVQERKRPKSAPKKLILNRASKNILAWFQLHNKLRIYTFKTPSSSYFLNKSYCFMRYSNLRVKLEQVH